MKEATSIALVAKAAAAIATAALVRLLGRNHRRRRALLTLLDKYDLTERGFLPTECCVALPPSLAAWERLSAQLPALNSSGTARQSLQAADEWPTLPYIDPTQLTTAETRRACVLLGQLVHSFVHGGPRQSDTVLATLPPTLGQSWYAVSSALGLPPVLTAAPVDLWNFQPCKRITFDSFRPISMVTGLEAERLFHAAPAAFHQLSAQLVHDICRVALLERGRDARSVDHMLWHASRVLESTADIIGRLALEMDNDEFYDKYRPWLGGWHPHRVELCAGQHTTHKGPSAGQSTLFMLLDAFVLDSPAQTAGGTTAPGTAIKAFQQEMLDYMPPAHRQLVLDVRAAIAGRDFGGLGGREAARCALARMRSAHMALARKHLRSTTVGTGASQWVSLLKDAYQATSRGNAQ